MEEFVDNRGVTLIELLVSISIMSIVLTMVLGFFSYSVKSNKYDDTQWQIQQDARRGIQQITKDVRQSIAISVSDDQRKLTLSQQMGGNIIFYISNNKLYREVNSAKNPVINNAKDIFFTWDDVDKVLYVQLTTKKIGADNEYSVSTKLYSRLD